MADPNTSIVMPDALDPILLPSGWTILKEVDPLTVACPEGDLTASFQSRPRPQDDEVEDVVRAAWLSVNSEFDLPIKQKAEMPTINGWDKEITIVYDAPVNESRMVFSIVRVLGGRFYISLVDGTKAAFSRRMAQIVELANGWRPAGLKEPSLADIAPRVFGEVERDALTDFVTWAMRRMRIPGVAVAVVQGDRTVYAEGFGVGAIHCPDPITPGTRFMIGSTTKPLTTLMMAKLVDMGYFAWTTPVAEILPGFALADSELTKRLEIRHTVCACTGMPRRDLDLLFRFRDIRPEDRIAEMKLMSPTTGFGETFQYSNYLVAVGGFAAAHTYAPSVPLADAYDRAMRELVFDPLGMQETSVSPNDSSVHAVPHGRDLNGNCIPIDSVIERFADSVAPSGSVWSTATDMARYLHCEIQNGVNENGDVVVSRENLLARRRSAVKIDGRTSYGLGLMLTERQGMSQVMHGGNTLGFSSDMLFLPEHALGIVILTNIRAANLFLTSLGQRLIELLFGAEAKAEGMVLGAATAVDNWLEQTRQRVKTDITSTSWLGDFQGLYSSQELGPAAIYRSKDAFRIEFESWSSDLGVEEQSNGSRQIVLTSPPWLGELRLQPTEDGSALVIDGGQSRYQFARVRQ